MSKRSIIFQAVKRNIDRFPDDFMFQLSNDEFKCLRSQIVTSNKRGGRRTPPYAFIEQGVAMLSSVLRSKRAVQVNVEIVVVFDAIREMMNPQQGKKKPIGFIHQKGDDDE